MSASKFNIQFPGIGPALFCDVLSLRVQLPTVNVMLWA
jgi:hypothetical protein